MNEEGKLVKEESNRNFVEEKKKKTSCTGFFEKKVWCGGFKIAVCTTTKQKINLPLPYKLHFSAGRIDEVTNFY